MRGVFLLLTVLAAGFAPARTAGAATCGHEAPPEAAERVLSGAADAVLRGSAEGVVAWVARGDEARLDLSLPGARGLYTSTQAEAVLADYFGRRTVVAVSAVDGSTTGGGRAFARTYRLRVRSRGGDLEGTLTVGVVRGREGWSLSDLAGDV